jgi:hypothetical protein
MTDVALSPRSIEPAPRRVVHYLTLVAIAAVVVAVSLPRLSEFALRENESDARAMMTRLAKALETRSGSPRNVEELVRDTSGLLKWSTDTEFLESGRLLRRHGYLFELVAAGDRRRVRAWPWSAGKTGNSAFLFEREPLLAHANVDGRWSGLDHPPEVEAPDSDWKPVVGPE